MVAVRAAVNGATLVLHPSFLWPEIRESHFPHPALLLASSRVDAMVEDVGSWNFRVMSLKLELCSLYYDLSCMEPGPWLSH